jgi:hypothetical protein
MIGGAAAKTFQPVRTSDAFPQKGEHRQGPVTRKTVTARTSHDSTVRSMFLSQFFAQFFPFGVKVTHAGFRISNLPR